LKDWKDKNPNAKPDDRLFPVSSIKKQFKSVLRRAGIDEKKYSPYSLRHGFAMLLAEKGADPLQLQNALTHADFRTTQHYIDAQEERQRAAMALLD
jgi:site-specific recombinase XerD